MDKNREDNILEKKCCECEIIKNIKDFSKNISSKDGYQNKCKGCVNIYNKKYREENRDIIKEYKKKYREENKGYFKKKNKEWREENRKIINERNKKYREENRNIINERSKKYYEENKDIINEKNKKYKEENKDRIRIVRREYDKKRILNDPLYKLKTRMRTLIWNSLKDDGYNKNSKSADILGCSYEELLKHLNDNDFGFIYGDDNLDIDHIIPLSRATSEYEILELNHYSNLQLLPSEYNRHIKIDNDFNIKCLEEWLKNK